MLQKQFASCELYFSCFRLTFVPTQLFLSWALFFWCEELISNTDVFVVANTPFISFPYKIKLIYLISRGLSLPLYEMAGGRYEIDYSLCEMIVWHNGCGMCFIEYPDDVGRSFDADQAIYG